MPIPDFISGLRLSEIFYREAVRPVLEERFPGLRHSAGRLATGSDVLGFDTPRSMDHGWGPMATIFVSDEDYRLKDEIRDALSRHLPYEIHGFPTHFSDPEINRAVLKLISDGPITHGVDIQTPRQFFKNYLGWDPAEPLRNSDWLAFAEQKLRTIRSGGVFHDGLGALEPIREKLRYYPHDVWLYLLSNQWRRISQEEPFVSRCGDVGDELGSRVLAGRLTRELMRLCFLMEKTYAPYSKWFGTGFSRLACAATLDPIFLAALSATDWKERERHLSQAYEAIAEAHNRLGITPPLPARVTNFHDRPYLVIQSENFADTIREAIADDEARNWPAFVGSVDQFADSTDILCHPDKMRALTAIYRE